MVQLPRRHWGYPESPRRALLVHGLSSDAASWWWVADELAADGWSVTAVDLRGHGAAERTARYALADYAADLPREGWDLVLGHSLGGAASVLAAQEVSFTRRLALLDPVLQVLPEAAEATIADQVSELEYTAESVAVLKPHWRDGDREAKLRGVRNVDPTAVTGSFTDTGTWDVTAQAAALAVPTVILSGDPAVYTMLDPGVVDRLGNPMVEYRVVPGTGHSPHRDRPTETMAALRAWLLETD